MLTRGILADRSQTRNTSWETRTSENGPKKHLNYWIKDYLHLHSYIFEWKHDRLPKSFATTGFHRTLSDYVNALIEHGLAITRLEEPKPSRKGVEVHPPMKKHYRIPQSIAIGATKVSKAGRAHRY